MKHILIIEDQKINCEVYRLMFEDYDYQIDFAYDGLDGFTKFEAHRYQLILLDLGLPKMHGLEVARRMREFETANGIVKTSIIAVTADSSTETRAAIIGAGIDDYLYKPFDMQDLFQMVSEYLND